VIGPYTPVRAIAEGGMGRVFEATGPRGERVAVKVLKSNDPHFLARFERERRLLAELGETEGFVPLLDTGTSPGGPYLVMPFLEGGSLRDRLATGPLPAGEVLALGVALAQALGRAHERGIVHRDLKPENVLFAGSGPGSRPLIADLGLAKHLAATGSPSITGRSTAGGTFGYMAPEQLEDMKSVGPAADVFSLGATLYECLAGAPPFGRGVLTYVDSIASGPPRPLHELGVSAPAELEAAIQSALQTDPARRPADGHAFARVLRATKALSSSRLGPRLVAVALGGALAVGLVLAWPARATRPAAGSDPPRSAVAPRLAPKTASSDSETARSLSDRSVAHFKANRFDEAIADTNRAIELDPSFAGAWHNRGAARFAKGDDDGAAADITRAIELDPSLADAWRSRGTLRRKKRDFEGSIADLTRAIELEPGNAQAWAERGSTREWKGDLEGAFTDASRAIELDPALGGAWLLRGASRFRTNDFSGALADLTRGVELDPMIADGWLNLGVARLNQSDYPGAIEAETRAIELAPGFPLAWANRGAARIGTHELEGAIADETKAIELDPTTAAAWLRRGQARLQRQEFLEAIVDETKAIELAPENPQAWDLRGSARLDAGDRAGAGADFEQVLRIDPGYGLEHRARALVTERQQGGR
jgi:serine/threonine protein kinase/lipoprotein NlpI